MKLNDVFKWLRTLPCDDAAWIMEIALMRLAGAETAEVGPFELGERCNVGLEDVMDWCRGRSLDDGIYALLDERGLDFSDAEVDKYVFQLAEHVALAIVEVCKDGER